MVPPAALLPVPFPLLGTAPATPTASKMLYKQTFSIRRMLLPRSQGQPWARGCHRTLTAPRIITSPLVLLERASILAADPGN